MRILILRIKGVVQMIENVQTALCIVWAVMIVVSAVVEAATAQMVSIWFVVGSIAGLISALFDVKPGIQIVIFTAVSIIALIITRPLVKKYIKPKKQPTNADKVIGQMGVVTQEINNIRATGQVKIGGEIWSARSVDNSIIPDGSEVIIDRIEGVKVMVKANN